MLLKSVVHTEQEPSWQRKMWQKLSSLSLVMESCVAAHNFMLELSSKALLSSEMCSSRISRAITRQNHNIQCAWRTSKTKENFQLIYTKSLSTQSCHLMNWNWNYTEASSTPDVSCVSTKLSSNQARTIRSLNSSSTSSNFQEQSHFMPCKRVKLTLENLKIQETLCNSRLREALNTQQREHSHHT